MQTNNKLREALVELMKFTCNSCERRLCEDDAEEADGQIVSSPCSAIIGARNALAEPVKNCDVGTLEEQAARFRKFCKKGSTDNFAATAYCAYECPCGNNYDCKLAWAQMPYEEGGAK